MPTALPGADNIGLILALLAGVAAFGVTILIHWLAERYINPSRWDRDDWRD